MRKIIAVMSLAAISWTSCTKDKGPQVLTKKEIKQQVDSIMALRNKDLNEEGQKDLQSRLKIEVKVKADSIIQARLNPPKPAANTAAQPDVKHQSDILNNKK